MFQFMKHLNNEHNYEFKVISFKFDDVGDENDIKKYCKELITIKLSLNLKKRYFSYLFNYIKGLFIGKISPKKHNYFDLSFSWKMQLEIDKLLSNEKFDLIFVDDFSMIPYVSDKDQLVKVLAEVNSTPEIFKTNYKLENNIIKKIIAYLNFLNATNYEKNYEKFDLCITATERIKGILSSKSYNLNCAIIPFGVDVDHNYSECNEDFPSILFLGTMSSKFNQKSVLYIYEKIYPHLKKNFPTLKFFIIGKGPSEEIIRLGNDESIIVTGYVKDIKRHISTTSVVVLPIHGFGIKTRLLEVMSVGKPAVIYSKAIEGINVTPNKNVLIADNSNEFINRITELLNSEDLRKEISKNAKKLMEEEYSWQKMANKLDQECQTLIKINTGGK